MPSDRTLFEERTDRKEDMEGNLNRPGIRVNDVTSRMHGMDSPPYARIPFTTSP